MMLSAALVLALAGPGQAQSTDTRRPPACGVAPASGTAAAELCLGEDQLRAAEAFPRQSAQRTRQLETAADHYRRAASLATTGDAGVQGLEALTKVYDAQHLDQPRQVESALREIIAQLPNDLRPVFRLADNDAEIAADWARGFLAGVTLRADAWEPLRRTPNMVLF